MIPGEDPDCAMDQIMITLENLILASIRAMQEQVPRPIRHRTYIRREHDVAHQRLFEDYFADEAWWGPTVFRRRFRIRRELFLRIVHTLMGRDSYFQMWPVDPGYPRLRSARLRSQVDLWYHDGHVRLVSSRQGFN